jgi:hypothetical protein
MSRKSETHSKDTTAANPESHGCCGEPPPRSLRPTPRSRPTRPLSGVPNPPLLKRKGVAVAVVPRQASTSPTRSTENVG